MGLLPEPRQAHRPGKGLPRAADSEQGLTLTSAEQGTRQRRVWPWKSGGALTSMSQGSSGASPGGPAAPGSAGGDGVLSTWLEVVLGCWPAPGAAGDRPASLLIRMRASHQGPTLHGPCHPEVLSILLPPRHRPRLPPALPADPLGQCGHLGSAVTQKPGAGVPRTPQQVSTELHCTRAQVPISSLDKL